MCAGSKAARAQLSRGATYLLKWNTILLGCLLFWFRFTLCTTIILVPQSLAIRGFEADQMGPPSSERGAAHSSWIYGGALATAQI